MLSFDALTFETGRAALEQGYEAIRAGQTVFDLSAVHTADSSSVALLLAWQRRALAAGQSLAYVNVPANIDSLANLYGVETLLVRA